MLTKWKVFNFKAIQQETELDLKPLTIFAGANSSGKSTVLQSMLLIAQTFSNEVINRPVILNGDFVRLGQFDDIKSFGSEASQIGVGWRLEGDEGSDPYRPQRIFPAGVRSFHELESSVKGLDCEITFDAESGVAAAETLLLQPALVSMSLNVEVDGQQGIHSFGMVLRYDPAKADHPQLIPGPQSTRFAVEFDEAAEELRQQESLPHEVEGAILRHFFPARLLVAVNLAIAKTEAIMRALSGNTSFSAARSAFAEVAEEPLPAEVLEIIREHLEPEHPLVDWINKTVGEEGLELRIRDLQSFMRRRRPILNRQAQAPTKDNEDLRLELASVLSGGDANSVIRNFLPLPQPISLGRDRCARWFGSKVKYLGPLREDPKPLYPLVANIDPRDVGLRGEHTASVFHTFRETIVNYLPADNFRPSRISQAASKRSLSFAVFDWLRYMGVADRVDTVDKGKLGHELRVSLYDGDASHDLTHVGVGVSQVLPIVVSCLLAEPDTLLIFEQPELHLHPKVQTLLGDFFLSMALLRKQCVLETHSEYLINRLRFRAAAAEGKQLTETIQIYFAEKEGSQARFRPVVVNEYGAILDWPEGFFDQSQEEAEKIIREATKKRKAHKNQNG